MMYPIEEIIYGYPNTKRRGQVSRQRILTDGYAVQLWLGADRRQEWFFFDSLEEATVMRTVARQSRYGCREGNLFPAVLEAKYNWDKRRDEIRLYLIQGEMPDWSDLPTYAQRWTDGLRRGSKWWHGRAAKHPRG